MLGSLTLRGIHDLLRLPLGIRKDLLLLRLRLGSGGPDGLEDRFALAFFKVPGPACDTVRGDHDETAVWPEETFLI